MTNRRDGKQGAGGSGEAWVARGEKVRRFAGNGVFCGKDGVDREKQRDFSRAGAVFCEVERGGGRGLKC